MEYLIMYGIGLFSFIGGWWYVFYINKQKTIDRLFKMTISHIVDENLSTLSTRKNNIDKMIGYHITMYPQHKNRLLLELKEKHEITSEVYSI